MAGDEGAKPGMDQARGRVFLFLQGPHGPFFRCLARRLSRFGAGVRRIAFNASDEAEWRGAGPLDRFRGPEDTYSVWLIRYLAMHRITDIVLYGDARPEHALAVAAAQPRGIRVHCLEEGYLRPHWITYERGGTNGNSPLNRIGLDRMALVMALASGACGPSPEPAPGLADDGWGSAGAHLWHSARYHLRLLFPSRNFGRHRSRRGLGLWREFGLYARRLATLPWRHLVHGRSARRLLAGDRGFHLALLQLSFDASMQAHSPYRCTAEFVADCIRAFARGAPAEDLLVFKTHPFEDGRERLYRVIAREAARQGVSGRVLLLDGGASLAALLDGALSVVTVNSTAGQQALRRGLPVSVSGRAVYRRPGLASDQDLVSFFAGPRPPSARQYQVFRRFLTETSQFRGSFYSRHGIRVLLARLPEALLARSDPYQCALGVAPQHSMPGDAGDRAEPQPQAVRRRAGV